MNNQKENEKSDISNKKNNIDFLINIAKEEYRVLFDRQESIYNRVNIFMILFIGISLHAFSVANNKCLGYKVILIILLLMIICLFLYIFVSKKLKFISYTIFDDELVNKVEPYEFKLNVMMNSYKKSIENNNKKFQKLCRVYNLFVSIRSIEIIYSILLSIFK